MRLLRQRRRFGAEYFTFNSLFEMHDLRRRRVQRDVGRPFNSLFEMLVNYHKQREAVGVLPFQFSI